MTTASSMGCAQPRNGDDPQARVMLSDQFDLLLEKLEIGRGHPASTRTIKRSTLWLPAVSSSLNRHIHTIPVV